MKSPKIEANSVCEVPISSFKAKNKVDAQYFLKFKVDLYS